MGVACHQRWCWPRTDFVWGEEVGLLRAVTRPGVQFAGKEALASRGQTRRETHVELLEVSLEPSGWSLKNMEM
jgi:hypothetical protein